MNTLLQPVSAYVVPAPSRNRIYSTPAIASVDPDRGNRKPPREQRFDVARIERFATDLRARARMPRAAALAAGRFDVMGGTPLSHARGDLLSLRV